MDDDRCPITRLPHDLRDSFLTQAFRQLDQQHLAGVIPLVCRQWQQLALSAYTSIDVTLNLVTQAQQLAVWLYRHGHRLESFSVTCGDDLCHEQAQHSLISQLQSLTTAIALRSLRLISETDWYGIPRCNLGEADISLSSLSSLTSSCLTACTLSPTTFSSLLSLTGLKSLDLTGSCCFRGENDGSFSRAFITQLSSTLVHLTSLNLRGYQWMMSPLKPLRNLPQLRQLELTCEQCDAEVAADLVHLPVTAVTLRLAEWEVELMSGWLRLPGCRVQALTVDPRAAISPAAAGQLLGPLAGLGGQLHELCIYGVPLTSNISLLTGLTSLTSLEVWRCGMEDADICQLSSLQALQNLELGNDTGFAWGRDRGLTNAEFTMQALAASLGRLTQLQLFGGQCAGAAAAAVQQAFGPRVRDVRVRPSSQTFLFSVS